MGSISINHTLLLHDKKYDLALWQKIVFPVISYVYASRHWELSNSFSEFKWEHRLIALLEITPILGSLVALVEHLFAVHCLQQEHISPLQQPVASKGIPSFPPDLVDNLSQERQQSIMKAWFKQDHIDENSHPKLYFFLTQDPRFEYDEKDFDIGIEDLCHIIRFYPKTNEKDRDFTTYLAKKYQVLYSQFRAEVIQQKEENSDFRIANTEAAQCFKKGCEDVLRDIICYDAILKYQMIEE